jgi:hypothetical protein
LLKLGKFFVKKNKKKIMKKTMTFFALMFLMIASYGQKYTTTGVVQYQKLDGYNYKRTLMLPSVAGIWGIYTDSILVKIIDWDKNVWFIKKRSKSGNKTTYIFVENGLQWKMIIDGMSVTTIEGANEELKSVYKITKVEKLNEAYSGNE